MDDKKYFSHADLAARYGKSRKSVKKISNMIRSGLLPKPDSEIGSCSSWSVDLIERWEQEHLDLLQSEPASGTGPGAQAENPEPALQIEKETKALQSSDDDKKKNEQVGLECRNCGCRHLPVDRTRKIKNKIIRYRHCRNCGRSKVTIERFAGP